MEDETPSALSRAIAALKPTKPGGGLFTLGTDAPPAPSGDSEQPPAGNAPDFDLYLDTLDFIAHNIESDPETALMLCREFKLRLEIDRQGAMLEGENLH